MREISLHVLDIAENGLRAGAGLVEIFIRESLDENLLQVKVKDNGIGMSPCMASAAVDPFVTTRTERRLGMGLSLFKAAALRCNGSFDLLSSPGKGTRVKAVFQYDHIDRAPLGDMTLSIVTLIAGNKGVDFLYKHQKNQREFVLDTREIKKQLGDISIAEPGVIIYLKKIIRKELDLLDRQE